MATLTNIIGYIYNAEGEVVDSGHLRLTLQQDMVSVDGTKVAPFTVTVDLEATSGLVDIDVYATDGASPSGLTYFVEYDSDPTDASKPTRNKAGYWSNYWAVPNVASVSLGSFTTALRGTAGENYLPLNGAASKGAASFLVGDDEVDGDKYLTANTTDANKPSIRWNESMSRWELTNDGTTFNVIATPVTGDITSVVAGTGLSGGGESGDVTIDIATQADPAWLTGLDWSKITGVSIDNADIALAAAIEWTKISKTGSSLADLTTRSASDLSSGTLPDARFPATLPAVSGASLTALNATQLTSGTVPLARISNLTDTEIAAAAAISWTKISKTGSSLADLTTRSASDLSSGTLPDAQFPATLPAVSGANLTNLDASDLATGLVPLARISGLLDAQIDAAAAITWTKISKTGSSLADLTTRSASDLSSGTLPDARFPAILPVLNGANLTDLDASDLASGTIPDARFPALLPAVSGLNLTNLNASNLSSGTIPDAQFPLTLPVASGENLTNLDASDLASGTVPSARLPIAGMATGTRGAVYVDNSTIIVDANGMITAISAAPSGAVGGDLSGTLPNPTVAKLRGHAISTTAPTLSGQMLRWNNDTSEWEPSSDGSQLTSLNATNLGSGTVPIERIGSLTDAQIHSSAAIAWTKISKVGAVASDVVGNGSASGEVLTWNGSAWVPQSPRSAIAFALIFG